MASSQTASYPLKAQPLKVVAANIDNTGANAIQTITKAAVVGQVHVLEQVEWSYSAAPTNGGLTVKFNNVTIKDVDITAAGPGQLSYQRPLESLESGTNCVVALAAGGAGITGKLSIIHYMRSGV